MRTFKLFRYEDLTGVSGTGIVAEGVTFANGKTVISWLTHTTSLVIYDSADDVIKIHGHGGRTVLEWDDEE